MIQIQERKTVKLPGITSLFVSFDFNRAIVDELKLLGNTNYDADTKEWEIPITSLSEFIDRVCKIDEINLNLAQDDTRGVAGDIELSLDTYKTKPFDYQQQGISFGLQHDSWLLLDAPGLGKSLQLIYLAEELRRRNNIQHCLIICGINTLKTNWKAEIEKHSNLDCTILGQRINRKGQLVIDGVDKRLEQLKNPIKEFFVIGYHQTLPRYQRAYSARYPLCRWFAWRGAGDLRRRKCPHVGLVFGAYARNNPARSVGAQRYAV